MASLETAVIKVFKVMHPETLDIVGLEVVIDTGVEILEHSFQHVNFYSVNQTLWPGGRIGSFPTRGLAPDGSERPDWEREFITGVM